MFKFLLFLCFGSWSRTHHCTPMLGILEDAPYVCLLYMGTVGIRKAQRSSRDVFHSGSQKTRLPLSIGSLRVTWCPRPMEDNGADPEAVASLPSAGAAGDPIPPSRCSSRELCGSRWFLPSLRFRIVLSAWKVSINFPHGLLVGWGGPGLVRTALAVLLSGSAASAEPSPRAMDCMGGWKMCPACAFPWLPEVIFQLFYGRGEPEGDSGLGLAARRETRVPSGSSAMEGGCGADLPAPDLLSLGYPWGVPWGSPSSGCSSSLWVPAPQPGIPAQAGDHLRSRGRPPSAAPSLRLQRRTLPTLPFLDLLREQTVDGAARVLKPGSPHPRLVFIFTPLKKLFLHLWGQIFL